MIFRVKFLVLVVIDGLQCVKSGHTPDFRKTRPDARTWMEKDDVSGETRTYGNPNHTSVSWAYLAFFYNLAYLQRCLQVGMITLSVHWTCCRPVTHTCADMGMTYSVIVQCTNCVVFPAGILGPNCMAKSFLL